MSHLLHALRLSALGLALAVTGCPGPVPAAAPFIFEICDNGVDDDGDGLVDCADPLCERNPACEEDCDNGVDDDGDGEADCEDASCARQWVCDEDCSDGVDNDFDAATDCDDTDCTYSSACAERCDNGLDDDGDGLIDCDDPGCGHFTHCWEDCANLEDDDQDGLVDCDDSVCGDTPSCIEGCDDGVDGDHDGLVDCDDPACAAVSPCLELRCEDGLDEDLDGLIDCDDPDCRSNATCLSACEAIYADPIDPRCDGDACSPACTAQIRELCDNGVDDNGDGAVDCADVGCTWSSACVETCDNGLDDDHDGWTDCEDPQCDAHPACPEVCDDGGADADGDGLPDCFESVCGGTCPNVEGSWPNGAFECDGACDAPRCRLSASCVAFPTAALTASLRADVPAGTLVVSDPGGAEGCDDGEDGDGDGLVDRWDPDCPATEGAWVSRVRLRAGSFWTTQREAQNLMVWSYDDRETETVRVETVAIDAPRGEVELLRDGALTRCAFSAKTASWGSASRSLEPGTSADRRVTYVAPVLDGLVTDCPVDALLAALPLYLRLEGTDLVGFEPGAASLARRHAPFARGLGAPYVIEDFNGDSPQAHWSRLTIRTTQRYHRAMSESLWYYAPAR